MEQCHSKAEAMWHSMVPEPGSKLVHSSVSYVKTVVPAGSHGAEDNRLVPGNTQVPEHSKREPGRNKQVRVHSRRVELGRTNRRRQIAA